MTNLPKYFKDHLDKDELMFARTSFETEKDFWKDNKFEIVKKRVRSSFKESLRNVDRLEEEKDLTEKEIKILISMCEYDLYLFAIRYFSHYLRKPSSTLHKYLYTFLSDKLGDIDAQRENFKHAVAAPRGGAKTSIVSAIFPIWCIAYNKKKFIIIVSDTVSQATDFLSDIVKEIEHNVLLLRDFPHLKGKGAKWRADDIITNNNIRILALGTKSRIRGRKFGAHRPDLLLMDDIESSDMVRSPSERDYIRYQWFNKDALYVGGEEGTYTDVLVVGTILGKDSLLNALLDPSEYPDWTSKKFSSVYKFSESPLWDKWEELYKNRFDEDRIVTAKIFFGKHRKEMIKGTEVLWPEGDPYYNLMITKISDPSGFSCEKQNSPYDITKILIPREFVHIENFYKNPDMIKIIKNKRNPWYGALDPSLGKKSGRGDYSCIITIIRDIATGYMLVVEMDLRRREVEDQIESILDSHIDYRYNLFAVETNAFQMVVADNLKKLSRKRGLNVPVKEINNYQDKKLRFESIVPIMKDGTIIFDSYSIENDQRYNRGFEQITTTTGDGDKFDDAFDALEMAVRIASAKKFKRRYLDTGHRRKPRIR